MPRKKKKVTNNIVFVLDTSGSMGGIREDVKRAYNEMLRIVKERSEQEGHQTLISLVMFDSRVEVVHYPTDARNMSELEHYPIRGSTALFDAVGKAVEVVSTAGDEDGHLVVVFTDGVDNVSCNYDARRVRKLIEDNQALGNWTFTFQLPPGQGEWFASHFGIPRDNVREWEATAKGVREARESTTLALGNYLQARSAGLRSVRNFYDVTTDLSRVSAKKVKKDLVDLSGRFRSFAVGAECSVKEFIEKKTGRPYVIGSAYYQLTKTEKVQPAKAILLAEKGKTAVYGGQEARDLIGLPTDGSDARVTPGNHANYDIFVQSTSVNRKLVRGTKVLVDMYQTGNMRPTWDHTKVRSA